MNILISLFKSLKTIYPLLPKEFYHNHLLGFIYHFNQLHVHSWMLQFSLPGFEVFKTPLFYVIFLSSKLCLFLLYCCLKNGWFIFIVILDSMIWIYQNLFKHFPHDRHLGSLKLCYFYLRVRKYTHTHISVGCIYRGGNFGH